MMTSSFLRNMTPAQRGGKTGGGRTLSISTNDYDRKELRSLEAPVAVVKFTLPEDLAPDGNWGIVISHGNNDSHPNGNLASPKTGGGLGLGSIILSVVEPSRPTPKSQSEPGMRGSEDIGQVQEEGHHINVNGNKLVEKRQNRMKMDSLLPIKEKYDEKIPVVTLPRQDSLLYLDKKGEVEAAMRLILTTAAKSSEEEPSSSISMTSTSSMTEMPGSVEKDQLPEVEIEMNGNGVDSTTRKPRKRGRNKTKTQNPVKTNPNRKCRGGHGHDGESAKQVNSQGESEVAMPLTETSTHNQSPEGPSTSRTSTSSVPSTPGFPETGQMNGNGVESTTRKLRKRNKDKNETQNQVKTISSRKLRGGRGRGHDEDSAKQVKSQKDDDDDSISECDLLPPDAVAVMLTRCDALIDDPQSTNSSSRDGGYDLRQRKSQGGGQVDINKKKRGQQQSARGPRPHKCPKCSRAFSAPATLKSHLLTHSKEKPYKCKLCSRSFSQQGTRSRHFFVKHSMTEPPHKCPTCSKGFSQKGNLKVHMHIHGSVKPYKCPKCSKGFSQGGTLKRHVEVAHPQ